MDKELCNEIEIKRKDRLTDHDLLVLKGRCGRYSRPFNIKGLSASSAALLHGARQTLTSHSVPDSVDCAGIAILDVQFGGVERADADGNTGSISLNSRGLRPRRTPLSMRVLTIFRPSAALAKCSYAATLQMPYKRLRQCFLIPCFRYCMHSGTIQRQTACTSSAPVLHISEVCLIAPLFLLLGVTLSS